MDVLGRTGYILLIPGLIWLALFFVIPFYSLVATSLFDPSGSVLAGYDMDFSFGNYVDALTGLLGAAAAVALVRRPGDAALPDPGVRAGLRHRLQGRPLEEPDAGAGDRAVLHQLPGAHAVVEADPGRRRSHREHAAVRAHPGLGRPAAGHAVRGDRRPDLQLPAVHGAAALRQHRQDRPAADRGQQRPLRLAVRRLLEGHLAALAARRHLRHAADLHPGGRRLHQRPAARQPEPADGRQRHPEPLHRRQRLPGGRCPVDDHDAAHRGDGLVLRPPRGYGGALCDVASSQPRAGPRPHRAGVHVRADRGRRADELQRPEEPAGLQVRRVHPAQLDQPLRGPEHVLGPRPIRRDRPAGHASSPRSSAR